MYELYYVYMMTNYSHSSVYIGVTNNLVRRVFEHRNDLNDGFTKRYQIHILVYYEIHETAESAILREKKLKNLVRRKKDALITAFNPKWDDLYDKILSFALLTPG